MKISETQISPVFIPTLLELAEYVTSVGIGIAIVASIIAMGGLIVSAIQAKKQSQTSSANLILELLKPWRQDLFKNALADMRHGNHNPVKVEELLNQLEDVAIFWKDETLTNSHVKEFFGANLKFVRDDKFIRDYMKSWVDKNPEYYFVNLRELIKKVDSWNL